MNNVYDMPYKIFFKEFDAAGNEMGRGVYSKEYKNYGNAERVAIERYGDRKRFECRIDKRDPWAKHTSTAICNICGKEYEREEYPDGQDKGCRVYISNPTNEYNCTRGESFRPCNECYARIHRFISALIKEKTAEEYLTEIDISRELRILGLGGEEKKDD